MPSPLLNELAVAAGLLVGLYVAMEVGYRIGKAVSKSREEGRAGQVGAIQGAILGLLGLLLGFSFAGAASRFMERQDLIVQEANAIGTAYLRADLLDEAHGSAVRQVLAEYVQHRLEVSKSQALLGQPETAKQVALFHEQLWQAARDGVRANPATMVAVLNPINEVIDLHSTRIAAGKKHLPILVLGLLIACSLLAIAVIGYGNGLAGKRSLPMTASLVILIAATLWTTIDLDHPRAGVMQLSDAPLEQLDLRPTP
jgi:hypothetical protein